MTEKLPVGTKICEWVGESSGAFLSAHLASRRRLLQSNSPAFPTPTRTAETNIPASPPIRPLNSVCPVLVHLRQRQVKLALPRELSRKALCHTNPDPEGPPGRRIGFSLDQQTVRKARPAIALVPAI